MLYQTILNLFFCLSITAPVMYVVSPVLSCPKSQLQLLLHICHCQTPLTDHADYATTHALRYVPGLSTPSLLTLFVLQLHIANHK